MFVVGLIMWLSIPETKEKVSKAFEKLGKEDHYVRIAFRMFLITVYIVCVQALFVMSMFVLNLLFVCLVTFAYRK